MEKMAETKPTTVPPIWIGYLLGAAFIIFEALFFATFWKWRLPNLETIGPEFIILGLIAIISIVYWFICVYRLHKLLGEATGSAYPITPGKAVGSHFVPLYNLYWIFKWTGEVVKFINSNSSKKLKPFLPGLLIVISVFVIEIDSGLGTILIFFALGIMTRKLNQTLKAPPYQQPQPQP